MNSVKYISLNGRIPSLAANGVAVMNTCESISKNDFNVTLIIPEGMGLPDNEYKDMWSFYDVKNNFEINKIKTYFKGKISTIVFLLKIFLLAFKDKESIFHARHIELAVVIGLLGRRVVFESHNFAKAKKRRLFFHVFIFLIKHISTITLISTTHAGVDAYGDFNVAYEKMKVLPNGVDPKKFDTKSSQSELRSDLEISEYRYVACHAGSLYEGRGVEEVLYAAKYLPDTLFLFVGGPRKRVDYYKKYCSKKGLKNVLFTGFVQQEELPKYILASDFVLMPYTSKTRTKKFMSPMKMFDYLASGRPIVASDFPVIREILEHNVNAILVDPDSGKSILDGIKFLMNHPELSAKISDNALSDAKKYTWEIRGMQISDWYESKFSL